MNLKIRAKNFDLSPVVEEYALKKISSLEKFLDFKKEALCEIELGRTTRHHKSGDVFRAEINIAEPGSAQVYVFAEEDDIYSAIDIVRDEAERSMVAKKSKRNTLYRKGAGIVKGLIKRIDIRKRWK